MEQNALGGLPASLQPRAAVTRAAEAREARRDHDLEIILHGSRALSAHSPGPAFHQATGRVPGAAARFFMGFWMVFA